jgi:hypothetical protein
MVARATISALPSFRGVTTREHTVAAPGGRALRVLEDGAPDGVPVIAQHGTRGRA